MLDKINDIYPWAKHTGDSHGRPIISVDPDMFYPAYFKEIKDHQLAKFKKHQERMVLLNKKFEAARDAEKIHVGREVRLAEREEPIVPEKYDRYWMECCFQAMKMDLQRQLGFNIEIRVLSSGVRKKSWNYQAHPEGMGVYAAAQGKGAREIYRSLRGFIPG